MLMRNVVSACSVSRSSRWVECADRKLTLCIPDMQTENIQISSVLSRAFLLYGGFMDKLQQRAIAFRHLIDYEYKIILGRKGKQTGLSINFEASDFFHLIGLHKLTDIINGKLPSEKIFYDCLKRNITYEQLTKSLFFNLLGNRFEYFHCLEKILDNNNMIFKCNTSTLKNFSRITADFELKNIYEALIFYLFIEKRSYSEYQCCKSFINNNIVDYTYGQTKMTLLYKEKINVKTGQSRVQYDKLTPLK